MLLALALPAPAAAESIAVPPGNSEADQYFETVPGLVNPRSPDSEKTVDDAVREGRLSEGTAQVLEQRGEAGESVARIVAQTAPVAPRAGGGAGGSGAGGGAPEAGAVGTAALAAPDEQGLGSLFPLIAVALAAAAGGYALAQWRRSRPKRPPSG